VIDRPPSAELAPDQQDSDSLPPYEVLDPILERFVEHDESVEQIVRAGFEEATVHTGSPHGAAQRVQTPPGTPGGARLPTRFRQGSALSHYIGVWKIAKLTGLKDF
jgi:hypothetical protein